VTRVEITWVAQRSSSAALGAVLFMLPKVAVSTINFNFNFNF
jgi:hypothetical protein